MKMPPGNPKFENRNPKGIRIPNSEFRNESDRVSGPQKMRHLTRGRRQRGGVLLEVLLALILFAATAAVVTTAFNASLTSLDRQKLAARALNHAASVVAEVQLGIRPANSDGSHPLESPFGDWTWETTVTPIETVGSDVPGLSRLEVIVRHQKSSTVQRLAQMVHLNQDASTNSMSFLPGM